MTERSFPIDTSGYVPLVLDPAVTELDAGQLAHLERNIGLVRDVIVFFTAISAGRGLAGHTGGAYDMVPEALIVEGLIRGGANIHPVLFDEAGHRVALQYALSAFRGDIAFTDLLDYRLEDRGLYGHPEIDRERGIGFASGRLGHIWPFVNGVAMANPEQPVIILGSDGAQMEGNDAEAARLAVAQNLRVKLLIDDNNVTIAGHPQEYMPGFDVGRTLAGHGLSVDEGEGEDFADLYRRIRLAVLADGPSALVNKRVMAPGVHGIEAQTDGHDAIPVKFAVPFLRQRGHDAAGDFLEGVTKHHEEREHRGSTPGRGSNRKTFGAVFSDLLDEIPEEERVKRFRVIDSDLAGSTGLSVIQARHGQTFLNGGVMERGNFSAAAGFGSVEGNLGVFSTFSAFLEMVISELTMARLNHANVLCHFSHAGVDAIADNTSHFGINIMFADNGLPEQPATPLYFPADPDQFTAVMKRIFGDRGPRFIFSTRSDVPWILDDAGNRLYGEGYEFEPGRDEVVREGTDGWIVAYGDMVFRALDAVERLKDEGLNVGLVNKTTINLPDEEMLARVGKAPFVLLAEPLNRTTGLGARFGTWLLERGLTPRYAHMGVSRVGEGGTFAQIPHQGLESDDIMAQVRKLKNS